MPEADQIQACPVCLSLDGFTVKGGRLEIWDFWYDCEVCGRFMVTDEAADYLGADDARLTPVLRAAVSHWIRLQQPPKDRLPKVSSDFMIRILAENRPLPSPGEQAIAILRYIGDANRATGKELEWFAPSFHAQIGSPNREFAMHLVFELRDHGLVKLMDATDSSGVNAGYVRLTLSGWERYEAERAGELAGNYGFIALKFGDAVLDPFLADVIKPSVRTLGFELRDMRDSARAGVIDNLLRSEIRNAAFILIDLTHENAGAYWEAGYAEGLGKPVLYLCERKKFEERKTHFDTNHCTTVLWDPEASEAFQRDLVATLQRSLES